MKTINTKFYSATILICAFLLHSTLSFAATLTRGPYLQTGTSTSVIVRWRSDLATDSRVRLGTSATNLPILVDNAQPTHEHIVEVTGLVPNTKYYYSIGSTTETLKSGTDTFFHTAPVKGERVPFRAWVIGDAGTGTAGQAAVYNAYRTFTGSTPTRLWLQLGDNAYRDGTDSQYQAKMFNVYTDMLRQSVTWPTLGNHDGYTADSATQTGPYYDIFTLPKKAEAGGVPSGTEAYYAFDFANVHFVVLDSYETSRAVGGPMYQWLEADLQATTADWIIAVWHHPPYTKGSHDSDTEHALVQMRQNFVPLIESYGVDMVLSGHSHSYERSKFIDGHYGLSSTFNAATHVKQPGGGQVDNGGAYTKASTALARAGTVYAVPGSSGKLTGGTLDHPAMHISLNELGSMVLDVDGLTLNAKFLNDNGSLRDYFTITKAATGTPGQISGSVWNDFNADGIRTAGEPPLANIEMQLLNAANELIAVQFSAKNGAYDFSNLDSGNYQVQVLKSTYSISSLNQGSNVTLNSDVNIEDGKSAVIALTAGATINNTDKVDIGLYAQTDALVTVKLREGLNAYTGAADTYVASSFSAGNYGNQVSLLADGDDGGKGKLVSLLKWATDPIPAGKTIISAKMKINVFNSSPGSYDIYAMNAGWDETTANWNNTDPLSNKGVCIGSLTPITPGDYTVTFNSAGIALALSWVNGAANNGMMIIDRNTTDGIDIRSSENIMQKTRPYLVLTYKQ